MDANPELFMWPELFFSDKVKPPPKAFYELFREAWRRKTWDLKELGVPCRNVLEDSSPILIQRKVLIVDSPSAMRKRKFFDEWCGTDWVWHLHWINESRLLWTLGDEDEEGFLSWLLEGMKAPWFCIAMVRNSSVILARYLNDFSKRPATLAVVNPIVEEYLQRFSQLIPTIREVGNRISVATEAQGLKQIAVAYVVGQLLELLYRTGRITLTEAAALYTQSPEKVWDDLFRIADIPNEKPVSSDIIAPVVPSFAVKELKSYDWFFDY